MRRTPGQPAAFSLFELVIVLVLVAIVSAIAVPRYSSSLDNYRASFAARKIAADLAMAQTAARAASASRTLSFTSAASYQVSGVSALNGATGTYAVDLSSDQYKTTVTVSFAGATQVTFDGYGHPDNAGSITVRSGGAVRGITLDAQSGACTIQ
jgi:prepilin-type N-terminal cleavage/methylation domain-containing protein